MQSDNVGKQIVRDILPAGGGACEGGKVRAADRDKTYRSTMQLTGDDLSVSGCVPGRFDLPVAGLDPGQTGQGSGGAGYARQGTLYRTTESDQSPVIQAIRPDRQALPVFISGRNALWHFRFWISDWLRSARR